MILRARKFRWEKAHTLFADQPFKLELIADIAERGEKLTVYATGKIFSDLCRGGHVTNTREIPADAFALSHIAGAYWKGEREEFDADAYLRLGICNERRT